MTLTSGSVRENHAVELDEGRLIAWRPDQPRRAARPPVGARSRIPEPGEVCGSDQARVGPERHLLDGGDRTEAATGERVPELLACGPQQQLPRCGHATADHEHRRIEHGGQGREPAAERAAHVRADRQRRGVALGRRLG